MALDDRLPLALNSDLISSQQSGMIIHGEGRRMLLPLLWGGSEFEGSPALYWFVNMKAAQK